MQHAGKAVDQVRRAEHKELSALGDDRLKGTKYDWLHRKGPPKFHRKKAFRELTESTLYTAQAWAVKEMLRKLWEYRSVTWARKYFERWYEIASTSGIGPIVKLGELVKRHIENILTYCTHRITNAVAERINSKIMSIKRL